MYLLYIKTGAWFLSFYKHIFLSFLNSRVKFGFLDVQSRWRAIDVCGKHHTQWRKKSLIESWCCFCVKVKVLAINTLTWRQAGRKACRSHWDRKIFFVGKCNNNTSFRFEAFFMMYITNVNHASSTLDIQNSKLDLVFKNVYILQVLISFHFLELPTYIKY